MEACSQCKAPTEDHVYVCDGCIRALLMRGYVPEDEDKRA